MDSLKIVDIRQELSDKIQSLEFPKYSSTNKANSKMHSSLFSEKETVIKNFKKSVESNKSTKQLESQNRKRKPAWTDPDDVNINTNEIKQQTKYNRKINHLTNSCYKEYLEKKFNHIAQEPKWATLSQNVPQDTELLRTVGFISKSESVELQQNYIQWKALKDLNRSTYAEGRITSIQFHPTSNAALIAGDSGIGTIYSVDGRINEKLHSIQFRKFPIKCAKIFPCGTKAMFGSTSHFYYVYDLLKGQEINYSLKREMGDFRNFQISSCGKYVAVAGGEDGVLHLFDAVSQEKIHSFKQENKVSGLRFTSDSNRIICNSTSNNVSIFCLRSLKMAHSFFDNGCIKGVCLDLSTNQRLIATGSCEGVVNVYEFENAMLSKNPLPKKCFSNLKTKISDVKFNHSSELLAMSSNMIPNAVKLAHISSSSVYTNFPNADLFGEVGIMEFSPHSGYLAFSNQNKQASLIKLKYFENY